MASPLFFSVVGPNLPEPLCIREDFLADMLQIFPQFVVSIQTLPVYFLLLLIVWLKLLCISFHFHKLKMYYSLYNGSWIFTFSYETPSQM